MISYATLTVLAAVVEVVLVVCVFVYVRRLQRRHTTPISERIGSSAAVLTKLRKRRPMSQEEFDHARQVIADRGSLLVYSIPAAIFTLGCFYVAGSLEQLHGATPSERTFLGVIPMITSTSLTLRLLKNMQLKRRLKQSESAIPDVRHVRP
ncbi:hypothetical protein LK468_20355 [Mycobacteroides abscessus]|uniref:hypothetical protein n=1 Tax=Mycobacteroides abscessus TaxID=36809 RepID=UPI001D146669|nr:hypothetical protein [Mycobacteroides abscessus]UEA47283.1 hypothetical protein LK451_15865 [Mycobacteroides abscessus subsp. abscessus]UEA52740.1 hypothetical protein LK468_20355 [Mycobacteroides abscessus]